MKMYNLFIIYEDIYGENRTFEFYFKKCEYGKNRYTFNLMANMSPHWEIEFKNFPEWVKKQIFKGRQVDESAFHSMISFYLSFKFESPNHFHSFVAKNAHIFCDDDWHALIDKREIVYNYVRHVIRGEPMI